MKGLLIYFDILPGRQQEFERAASLHARNIRERDPSYSLYSLARIRDSETRYVLVQRFESWESQLTHQGYDYVAEGMKAINPCIAGPPTIEWLDIID